MYLHINTVLDLERGWASNNHSGKATLCYIREFDVNFVEQCSSLAKRNNPFMSCKYSRVRKVNTSYIPFNYDLDIVQGKVHTVY
jgi:hypothetical protein